MTDEKYYLFEEWEYYDSGGMRYYIFDSKNELNQHIKKEYNKKVKEIIKDSGSFDEQKERLSDFEKSFIESFGQDKFIIKGEQLQVKIKDYKIIEELDIFK